MYMNDTRLPIGVETLEELEEIALGLNLREYSDLKPSSYQLALSIQAIIHWLESYGLEAPFKLEKRK